jgi:hypothetical protein
MLLKTLRNVASPQFGHTDRASSVNDWYWSKSCPQDEQAYE